MTEERKKDVKQLKDWQKVLGLKLVRMTDTILTSKGNVSWRKITAVSRVTIRSTFRTIYQSLHHSS